MRTFVAIDIPASDEIKNLYADLSNNLKGIDIKYAELNNYHITLTFIGETETSKVSGLCEIFEHINFNFNNIELNLANLGFFKNGQIPSVIWVGIEHNKTLQELWTIINQVVTSVGFKVDQRKFQPHLTVGRIKKLYPNNNLESFKVKYQNTSFGKVLIAQFVYYQSILTPQGPIYKPIQKFKI